MRNEMDTANFEALDAAEGRCVQDGENICEANKPCENPEPPARRMSLYERNRAAVYATGNRWAIENFNATH